jgi:hypothetical protein
MGAALGWSRTVSQRPSLDVLPITLPENAATGVFQKSSERTNEGGNSPLSPSDYSLTEISSIVCSPTGRHKLWLGRELHAYPAPDVVMRRA